MMLDAPPSSTTVRHDQAGHDVLNAPPTIRGEPSSDPDLRVDRADQIL